MSSTTICRGKTCHIEAKRSGIVTHMVVSLAPEHLENLDLKKLTKMLADAIDSTAKNKANPVIWAKLDLKLEDLVQPCSNRVRILNVCCHNKGIVYIGQLVQLPPKAILLFPNLGKQSLIELEGIVSRLELRLSMTNEDVENWKPPTER